ncbi:MAG: hypothetical protein AAF438_06800 [Pseudomonadota bacterium]
MTQQKKEDEPAAATSRPVLREATIIILRQWYENEVYLGRANYAPGKKMKTLNYDVPADRLEAADPLADAKRARPWAWKRTFKRDTGRVDKYGNPVMESVSILDVLGRGPYETPRQISSKPPAGPHGVRTEISSRGERDSEVQRARIDWFKRIHKGMGHLVQFAPEYADVLLQDCAGYTRSQIAKRMGLNTTKIQDFYECGMTWLTGCLSENPLWRTDLPEYQKLMRDLLDFAVPIMEASDLGIPGSYCDLVKTKKRALRRVFLKT